MRLLTYACDVMHASGVVAHVGGHTAVQEQALQALLGRDGGEVEASLSKPHLSTGGSPAKHNIIVLNTC
jgi:hypothetical protein